MPLVVRWTGRIDAPVASSHVEAHAIRPTAYILLQTLINILTCLSIEHELIARRADTLIAPKGIFTLMLAGVSIFTFINIYTGSSNSLRPVTSWTYTTIAASCIFTYLVISALMGPIFTLININAGSIFYLGHSVWTKIDAFISTTGVLAVLIWSAHILSTLIYIQAFSAFELIPRFTSTVKTSDGIETAVVTGAGFLTFVNILTTQPISGSSKANSTADHTAIGSNGIVTVLTSMASVSTQSTLINILTSSSICSDGEAFGAGAIVGSHGIVTDMGAGIPCSTFIFISTEGSN